MGKKEKLTLPIVSKVSRGTDFNEIAKYRYCTMTNKKFPRFACYVLLV